MLQLQEVSTQLSAVSVWQLCCASVTEEARYVVEPERPDAGHPQLQLNKGLWF
jgi:hypothetical protein